MIIEQLIEQFLGPILAATRVSKAKQVRALELNLSSLLFNRLPRKLAHVTSLEALDLSECRQLFEFIPAGPSSRGSERSTSPDASSSSIYPRWPL